MHNPNFNWGKQNIIVTGGSGFLGGHLVEHLESLGAREIVVPRKRDYDLREQEAVEQLYNDHPNTTMVIHLAATVGGIGANREHPGLFFYDNMVMGTMLLEHARRNQVAKFVGIGTICSYPKFTPIPFKEDNIWDGYPEETNAPYGLAKKMLLVQSQAYRQEFGYNAIHLLPTNLYGPRDNFNPTSAHVIPDMIRKIMDAKERGDNAVVMWGDGSPTREFVYVKDAAVAIAGAAANYDGAEPVNIGSAFEISIRDLAELIVRLLDFKGEIQWDTSKPNGQPRRKLDISKAEAYFGFRATTPFEAGLRETIDWYKMVRHQPEIIG